MSKPTLTLDGRTVEFDPGQTILEDCPPGGHLHHSHPVLYETHQTHGLVPDVRGGGGRLAHPGPGLLHGCCPRHGHYHRIAHASMQPAR